MSAPVNYNFELPNDRWFDLTQRELTETAAERNSKEAMFLM
jgi:hypothetical protein